MDASSVTIIEAIIGALGVVGAAAIGAVIGRRSGKSEASEVLDVSSGLRLLRRAVLAAVTARASIVRLARVLDEA